MNADSVVVGLDLAGVEHRPSGFCHLRRDLKAHTEALYSDEQIISRIRELMPNLVCIDAPLGLPRGRCCLKDDCECRGKGHLRACDREMLKLRIKFFPLTLGPMRILTMRGMRLTQALQHYGFNIIESHPGGIQDILGVPRKTKGIQPLRRGLIRKGILGDTLRKDITHDELDAVTLAFLGLLHLNKSTMILGEAEEGLIILPKFPSP